MNIPWIDTQIITNQSSIESCERRILSLKKQRRELVYKNARKVKRFSIYKIHIFNGAVKLQDGIAYQTIDEIKYNVTDGLFKSQTDEDRSPWAYIFEHLDVGKTSVAYAYNVGYMVTRLDDAT